MDVLEKTLELNSFNEFNPMQKQAIKRDIFTNNVVISAPTTSGKTLLAEICSLNSIINRKRKVVYLAPLRALAYEHYNSFKKKYSKTLSIKCAISTGDFDSTSKYLSNYDIIFSTNEKVDSLLRHRADWLSRIGLLVADEIHELDSGRGPTLEMVITRLRLMNPKMQILALSATIPNALDIANWLDAELIESNFRPVKLKEGIHFNQEIEYSDSTKETISSEHQPIYSLAKNTLEKSKQALIFVNTRKLSETTAKSLVHLTEKTLTQKEKTSLQKASDQTLAVLEQPTEQCKLLSKLISEGVCFHNAGILQKQREIIENEFRNHNIKILATTTTLAAGINLPAHTVMLPYLHRYTSCGMTRIPVREVKQQCGRAGRTGLDKEGRAVLFAKSEIEKDELMDFYIKGEIETVNSQLSIEPILRTHLLAAIASRVVFNLASMEDFFSKTFYAFQFGDLQNLLSQIMEIIQELEDMDFVVTDEREFRATRLGQRVSELYLDPVSADHIVQALKNPKKAELFYLYLISNTTEMHPYISFKKKQEPELLEQAQTDSDLLPIDFEKEQFYDTHLLKKYFTSLLFKDWINEISEQELVKTYNSQPGIIHAKLRIVDWLAYASSELAKILRQDESFIAMNKLRKRLKYGVKEELIPLTELRGIGRVRARLLWKSNVKTISKLKEIPMTDLARILPPKIAQSIKKQLGQKTALPKSSLKKPEKTQSTLKEF